MLINNIFGYCLFCRIQIVNYVISDFSCLTDLIMVQ